MRGSLKRFKFTYYSIILVIILEVISVQALIQYALSQEVAQRNEATMLGRQSKRAELVLLYSEKIVIQPATRSADLTQLRLIVPVWEGVEQATVSGQGNANVPANLNTDPLIFPHVQNSTPDYAALDTDAQRVLSSTSSQKIYPIVEDMVTHEENYVTEWAAIFSVMSTRADQTVIDVRWIEVGLFLLTIATIACEVLFVFVPSMQRMTNKSNDMYAEIDVLKEKVKLLDAATGQQGKPS